MDYSYYICRRAAAPPGPDLSGLIPGARQPSGRLSEDKTPLSLSRDTAAAAVAAAAREQRVVPPPTSIGENTTILLVEPRGVHELPSAPRYSGPEHGQRSEESGASGTALLSQLSVVVYMEGVDPAGASAWHVLL